MIIFFTKISFKFNKFINFKFTFKNFSYNKFQFNTIYNYKKKNYF